MVLGNPSIEVSDLSVEYTEFDRTLMNPFGRKRTVVGLNGVSFSISNGDVVALIGRNGAGKSTLLRSIAGLLRPNKGSIRTCGRVILLSGADPGFSYDMTGSQNLIELSKAYGVDDEDITEFCDEICDFADIGDAIERNVRGYSTGMRGKLGFGFITSLRPDILLIDETLGVGDAEFRKKAMARLKQFVTNSGSVIISTHSLGLAKELCNKGLLLDYGRLVEYGSSSEALSAYEKIRKEGG